MVLSAVLCLLLFSIVTGYPSLYQTSNFKVGIEYDHSLPMSGGSDRYRHRNNNDPFFVTVTAKAKKGYVISYLQVTTTTLAAGDVEFSLVRGQTGAQEMAFQLVSNNTDFLSYSYLTYGIREEEYRKIANVITLPLPNKGRLQRAGGSTLLFIPMTLRFIIP